MRSQSRDCSASMTGASAVEAVGEAAPDWVTDEGTEVEEGRKIIAESDVDIITADDINDAARKVVATLA